MKWMREHALKDGRVAVLRSAEPRDAEQMVALMHRTMGETLNMSRYPDELKMTPEQERAFLQRALDEPRGLLLGAFIGGEAVGSCSVMQVSLVERQRHRAGLGIAVLRDYWHIGIGTALMGDCMEAARLAGYEQVELDVRADNARARALYERMGFAAYGVQPHAMKYRDGTYADLVLMQRRI